jgi:DNA invertase Pin-like site-specific DNA recombinase
MTAKKEIDYAEVSRLASLGGSWYSIAKKTDVSWACLKTRCRKERPILAEKIRKNGLKRWGKVWLKIDLGKALEMREEGKTYKEIAAAFGASYSSAAKMIRKHHEEAEY